SDSLLQPYEIWVYTGSATLTSTTTNTATASGTASQTVVTDTGTARVAVSTVSGGELPDTGTPWYGLWIAGLTLVLIGAFGLWRATRKTHG
ncbi:MAG: LPXTG cell wall anchor domain-containing protein, partial [Acidimicrobiales bacterium]|nr:LPXTG cell wall anchor domain-containing protein [Acidimicrobiales bacterium]